MERLLKISPLTEELCLKKCFIFLNKGLGAGVRGKLFPHEKKFFLSSKSHLSYQKQRIQQKTEEGTNKIKHLNA